MDMSYCMVKYGKVVLVQHKFPINEAAKSTHMRCCCCCSNAVFSNNKLVLASYLANDSNNKMSLLYCCEGD